MSRADSARPSEAIVVHLTFAMVLIWNEVAVQGEVMNSPIGYGERHRHGAHALRAPNTWFSLYLLCTDRHPSRRK